MGELVKGLKVYDPRDKKFKVSSNPALMLGHLINMNGVICPWMEAGDFRHSGWELISKMADYCDEEIDFDNEKGG